MDAELIAIGRVRRAVKDLSEPAQVRVLQWVVQGLYEAQQERHRAEQLAMAPAMGQSMGGAGVRMSEARQTQNAAN